MTPAGHDSTVQLTGTVWGPPPLSKVHEVNPTVDQERVVVAPGVKVLLAVVNEVMPGNTFTVPQSLNAVSGPEVTTMEPRLAPILP